MQQCNIVVLFIFKQQINNYPITKQIQKSQNAPQINEKK